MRPVVVSGLAVAALLACAPASIGSLDGTGVGLPDRTADESDASTARSGATTATLTVTLAGPGTVTSAPSGLTCTTTTCTGTFAIGTVVSLAAEPTGSAAFSGWAGGCTGTSCTVTLAAATAVTANFATLDGTWKGTYENKRTNPNSGCKFDNKGNLTLTTTANGDAGTSVGLTASMDGMEIRGGDCNLANPPTVSGDTSKTKNNAATVVGSALTGTWVVNAGTFGTLDFPFKATVTGNTMTGTWTCATCTEGFVLTKQP